MIPLSNIKEIKKKGEAIEWYGLTAVGYCGVHCANPVGGMNDLHESNKGPLTLFCMGVGLKIPPL